MDDDTRNECRAEVTDVGGCQVGTAVLVGAPYRRALAWLQVRLSEPWAGPWHLSGPNLDLCGTSVDDLPSVEQNPAAA